MFSKEDLDALKSSEIFSSFVESELKKEAAAQQMSAKANETAVDDFFAMQELINQSPKLKTAFRDIQRMLATNAEYAKTVDQNFVAGVMLLKLDD